MRLIDADALEDVLVNHGFCYCGENEYNDGVADGFLLARDDVKEAPTIATAEVRHGKWIECESENGIHIHKCSECGKRDMYKGAFKDFNGRGFSFYYKRQCCPYCGARMEIANEDAD